MEAQDNIKFGDAFFYEFLCYSHIGPVMLYPHFTILRDINMKVTAIDPFRTSPPIGKQKVMAAFFIPDYLRLNRRFRLCP